MSLMFSLVNLCILIVSTNVPPVSNPDGSVLRGSNMKVQCCDRIVCEEAAVQLGNLAVCPDHYYLTCLFNDLKEWIAGLPAFPSAHEQILRQESVRGRNAEGEV
jgi:hypothetical protein